MDADDQKLGRICPSAPTNLTLHQALDINAPIGCGDVAVWPGDILVGDGEGVVAIPRSIAAAIADEAVTMTHYEAWALAQVQDRTSILGLYPLTDEQRRQTYNQFLADRGHHSMPTPVAISRLNPS